MTPDEPKTRLDRPAGSGEVDPVTPPAEHAPSPPSEPLGAEPESLADTEPTMREFYGSDDLKPRSRSRREE